MPKVSIYIPAYNVEKTIEKVLISVFSQSLKFDEIIVINDFSNDNTKNILNSFKDIQLINNQKNMGLSFCRNKGLKLSKNELVASIDGDVVLDKYWLENIIKTLTDEIMMSGGNMIEKNLDNKFNLWRAKYYSQNWGDKDIKNPSFLFGCNTIQKKKLWSEVNGYNEELRSNGEDIDYCFKIKNKGFSTFYCNNAKCYHLQNDDFQSLSSRIWRYHSHGYKIRKQSFLRFLKLTTKQIKFCFKRSIENLINFNFNFIVINIGVLINFIKFEFNNTFKKK
jgi:GT2 family glycosyltransferase